MLIWFLDNKAAHSFNLCTNSLLGGEALTSTVSKPQTVRWICRDFIDSSGRFPQGNIGFRVQDHKLEIKQYLSLFYCQAVVQLPGSSLNSSKELVMVIGTKISTTENPQRIENQRNNTKAVELCLGCGWLLRRAVIMWGLIDNNTLARPPWYSSTTGAHMLSYTRAVWKAKIS